MKEILLLVDYKGHFGIKYNAVPYRSGLDISEFQIEMEKFGYRVILKNFFSVSFENPEFYKDKFILYQSSEANDWSGEYKSYIDDVLYFLKLSGAKLIPEYKYFKAHGNKSFMEMLRNFVPTIKFSANEIYGSREDFLLKKNKRDFPVVIKKAEGALSKGVFLAKDDFHLKKIIKKISKSHFFYKEYFKDKLRKFKYKGDYQPFSIHRNKFVIQPLIPDLKGDYKILIFHDIFYIVKRDNPPNDFRASGGGFNSFTGEFDLPEGILDYAFNTKKSFNCPYISIDVGLNKTGFHLIEFQFINFGTSGHSKSNYYYKKGLGSYELKSNDLSIEHLYVYSIKEFLKHD